MPVGPLRIALSEFMKVSLKVIAAKKLWKDSCLGKTQFDQESDPDIIEL